MMQVDERLEKQAQTRRDAPTRADLMLAWGPALLWAAAIFYVSAQNTWTVFEGPPWVSLLRKCGHVFEYVVLALLVGRGLIATFTGWGSRPLTRRIMLRVWQVGVVLVTLYAATDEVHQLFVPKRVGYFWDVLVDGLSATAALGIWYIVRVQRKVREKALNTTLIKQ